METEEKKEGKVTKVVDKIKQSIETTEKYAEEYKFLVKAAEKLGEFLLEELKESKDITGLEYIATYAPRDKIHIWKSAINAIHDIELAGEPAVYGKVAAKTKKVLSVDSEK
jgi:transcriptional regulator NrdR family protein